MKHDLFSSPLHVFDVPCHAALKVALIEDIRQWREEDPEGIDRGRPDGGTWESHHTAQHRPAFAPLAGAIEAVAEEAAPPGKRLAIGSMWANVARERGFRVPHYHAGGLWAGVYYLALGDPPVPTTFLDPRGGAPHALVYNHTDSFELPAREGELLLFPVWLLHYVRPRKFAGERVTVSLKLSLAA
ncbi:MAG: hypothetical protein F4Y03_18285 [Alphaproteobacteria bacterium]|nr:hypothetical protein [Alphaproteobacteria bacterium]